MFGMESLSQTYYHQEMSNSFELSLDFKAINIMYRTGDCDADVYNLLGGDKLRGYCEIDETIRHSLKDGGPFYIDFLRKKTQLNPNNYANLVKRIKSSSDKNIFNFLCDLNGLQPSESWDEICEGLSLGSPISIPFSEIRTYNSIVPEITFEVQNFNFTAMQLFMIKRDPAVRNMSKGEVRDTSFELEFMFTRGNKNILGMNFLEGKLLSYDSFSSKLNLGDASFLNDYQDSLFSTYLALKVTIDIFIFIFLITLIFAAIINFDKFINEEE